MPINPRLSVGRLFVLAVHFALALDAAAAAYKTTLGYAVGFRVRYVHSIQDGPQMQRVLVSAALAYIPRVHRLFFFVVLVGM